VHGPFASSNLREGASKSFATAPWLGRERVPGASHAWSFEGISDGQRHWIRVDVRDADGRLALTGNPHLREVTREFRHCGILIAMPLMCLIP
jgi:hypothetical protein